MLFNTHWYHWCQWCMLVIKLTNCNCPLPELGVASVYGRHGGRLGLVIYALIYSWHAAPLVGCRLIIHFIIANILYFKIVHKIQVHTRIFISITIWMGALEHIALWPTNIWITNIVLCVITRYTNSILSPHKAVFLFRPSFGITIIHCWKKRLLHPVIRYVNGHFWSLVTFDLDIQLRRYFANRST